MGIPLNLKQLQGAEETMKHFPKGDVSFLSLKAAKALETGKLVGPHVSPQNPRAKELPENLSGLSRK